MKGPSVTSSSPDRTRTVVASSRGRNRSPMTHLPRPFTSSNQASMSGAALGSVSGSVSVATNIRYFIADLLLVRGCTNLKTIGGSAIRHAWPHLLAEADARGLALGCVGRAGGVRLMHQSGSRRVLSRQNSLPSGSVRTCHGSCPLWPMSAGRAPSFRRRSSSAS